MRGKSDKDARNEAESRNHLEEQKSILPQRSNCPHEEIEFLFHEIRTPLTAIISYAEILQTQKFPVSKQRSLLDIIRKEGRHIDALLNDFSEYCHHESGEWLADMHLSPINVGDLLQEAATRFSAKSGSHPIRVEISANLPLIQGDEEKLYLVIRNLLANASKFSSPDNEIRISAVEDSKNVSIIVRDQGIGIPKESLPDIFNQRFRGTFAKGNRLRGVGLGLANRKAHCRRA